LPRIVPLRLHADGPRQHLWLPPFPPVRRAAIRGLIMRKKEKSNKTAVKAKAVGGTTPLCFQCCFLREGIPGLKPFGFAEKFYFLKKGILLKRGQGFASVVKNTFLCKSKYSVFRFSAAKPSTRI
jgi:hypothetical protein